MLRRMKKRATAGVLWFFSGLVAVEHGRQRFIGVTTALGPVFGVLAALLIAVRSVRPDLDEPLEEPAR